MSLKNLPLKKKISYIIGFISKRYRIKYNRKYGTTLWGIVQLLKDSHNKCPGKMDNTEHDKFWEEVCESEEKCNCGHLESEHKLTHLKDYDHLRCKICYCVTYLPPTKEQLNEP